MASFQSEFGWEEVLETNTNYEIAFIMDLANLLPPPVEGKL